MSSFSACYSYLAYKLVPSDTSSNDSFCSLPEITQDALAEEMHAVGLKSDDEPFWKQYRCIFGW